MLLVCLCGFHVSGLKREPFHAVLKECVISEICLLFTKIFFSFLAREFFQVMVVVPLNFALVTQWETEMLMVMTQNNQPFVEAAGCFAEARFAHLP